MRRQQKKRRRQPLNNSLNRKADSVVYIGVDEVGRGCLAGPVVAAAVYFPSPIDFPSGLLGDSKQMSTAQKSRAMQFIREHGVFAIGQASVDEIEQFNILNAALLAMRRAVLGLKTADRVRVGVDGNQKIPGLPAEEFEQHTIVGGDRLDLVIGAASIVAKVTRDQWMCAYDDQYPGYSWAKHKGYGTPEHLRALATLGPCEIHRRRFKGVKEYYEATEKNSDSARTMGRRFSGPSMGS